MQENALTRHFDTWVRDCPLNIWCIISTEIYYIALNIDALFLLELGEIFTGIWNCWRGQRPLWFYSPVLSKKIPVPSWESEPTKHQQAAVTTNQCKQMLNKGSCSSSQKVSPCTSWCFHSPRNFAWKRAVKSGGVGWINGGRNEPPSYSTQYQTNLQLNKSSTFFVYHVLSLPKALQYLFSVQNPV